MSEPNEAAATASRVVPARYPNSKLSALGPPQLTARDRLLIEYMTFGCSIPGLLVKLTRPAVIDPDTGVVLKPSRHPEPGDQLSLEEASEIVGMRRRTARILVASPIGQKALAKAVQALRDGVKVEAMRGLIDIMRTPGDGKAADRKVQLEAIDRILGLEQTKQQAVNVTINNAVAISPGLVIRDPREQVASQTTIEHDE